MYLFLIMFSCLVFYHFIFSYFLLSYLILYYIILYYLALDLFNLFCSMSREEQYHEFLLPNPLAQSSKKETIAECLLSPSKARHIVVPPSDTSLFVVRTPRANASLLSLKDFENQVSIKIL